MPATKAPEPIMIFFCRSELKKNKHTTGADRGQKPKKA